MYESFYNLKAKPFALLPDSDFLYAGKTHRAAYSHLEYGLISEAPFIVLTGDPGMGKTSLLQKLVAEHGGKHAIGLVTNARYDVEHLLPWILLSLGLCQSQLDPVAAYHTFSEFLNKEAKQKHRVILIIDEAQSLGAELLEELRLLSNMNDGKTLKLQIILSGQPDLHSLLKRVDMTQFAQRIVVDHHLEPLSEEETGHCIRHRLQVAGGNQPLFTKKACGLIHRVTRGNPRLITQVCDIALTYGFAEQARVITAKVVAQAALDRTKGGILPLTGREDLPGIVNTPDDLSELEAYAHLSEPAAFSDSRLSPSAGSPESLYANGMTFKQEGRYKDAIDRFHLAGKADTHWLKAHAQIGLCYRMMGESRSAIQSFRTALSDQYATRKDIVDVKYFLARTLELAGKQAEAIAVYREIIQMTPNFKDVAQRVKDLSSRAVRPTTGTKRPANGDSWVGGAIQNFQRLMGSHK